MTNISEKRKRQSSSDRRSDDERDRRDRDDYEAWKEYQRRQRERDDRDEHYRACEYPCQDYHRDRSLCHAEDYYSDEDECWIRVSYGHRRRHDR